MYELIDDIIFSEGKCIPLDTENSDYQKVLDDIIEQGADCFDGDIPTDLQTAADVKRFAQQLSAYTTAIARLAQYVLSVGRTEVVESLPTGEQVWDEDAEEMVDVMADFIIVTAIDALDATVEQTTYDEEGVATTATVENPLITTDVAERATAQAVVDATPSAVVDTYNA
jgi:DNA-binding FrmR family transcriptional regulator